MTVITRKFGHWPEHKFGHWPKRKKSRLWSNFLLYSLALLLLLFSCAPVKSEITEIDYKRLIHYSSSLRLKYNLEVKENEKIPNDLEIFIEACSKLKLNPDNALLILKDKNPKVYEQIQKYINQK